MFKATMNDAKAFKDILSTVAALLNEVVWKVTPEAISITGMDESHIALIHIELKKNDFDLYEVDESLELGINMIDYLKILNRGKPGDKVMLEYIPQEKKLLTQYQAESSKKTRKHKLSLVDIEGEEIDLDSLQNMEYANTFTIDLATLVDANKDADIYAEVIQYAIPANLDKVLLSTAGNVGDMVYEIEKDELTICEFEDAAEGIYALSYLNNIYKIRAHVKTVEIGLKSETPLRVKATLLNESNFYVCLAPRVEEDDDSMYEE